MIDLRSYSRLALVTSIAILGVACRTSPPAVPAGESKIVIRFGGNAQAELISSNGPRILIDVWEPDVLSSPATPRDILLTTHHHSDHYSGPFMGKFQGLQLDAVSGRLELPGGSGTILGLASAHGAGEEIDPSGGSNNLFLVEIAGLRIAHFGDIGQEALSAEQLEKLGRIDLLFTQFANSYSDMDAQNQKGFKIVDQVKPRLVIPTHFDMETAQVAAKRWPAFYSEKVSVSVSRADLPANTTIVFMGAKAKEIQQTLNLPAWTL